MTIAKVLIANRGEIAVRLIRACQELGLNAVAVYSDADRGAPHTLRADEALHIGPSEARLSYLDGDKIIAAAKRAGADAVHPGYGFLAENAAFAKACADAGLTFIGPRPDVIARMGSKIAAKAAAVEAGVPVVPGYHGQDQSDEKLRAEAERIGTPLLIKASAGGGGRGMRQVHDLEHFDTELRLARQEALSAFGDDSVLLERFIETSRHIEVQILGDRHGNVLHLFERDCSLQRNHQKVIEEAPAPALPPATRQAMLECAVRLAASLGYDNAGTIEFILDAKNGAFFFLEMNTRLQVEHPVTEMVTGIDIASWQIRVAGGEPLPFAQDDIACRGWAVEARVAAEDPAQEYRPQTGTVSAYTEPSAPGLRIDSGIAEGSSVGSFYDSMLAKVIAHGEDRKTAIGKLNKALGAYRIGGVGTNIRFLSDLLSTPTFLQGKHHTGLLAETWPEGWKQPPTTQRQRMEAVLATHLRKEAASASSPWSSLGAWRITEPVGRAGTSTVHLREPDAEDVSATISGRSGDFVLTLADGPAIPVAGAVLRNGTLSYDCEGALRHADIAFRNGSVLLDGREIQVLTIEEALLGPRGAAAADGSNIIAPMPGMVSEILVQSGQTVSVGEPVVIIEAMKLLQTLTAPKDGTVTDLRFKPGEAVENGALIIAIEPLEE